MMLRKNLLFFFSSLGLLTILATSCENDPAHVGIDILPPSDHIYASVSDHKLAGTNIRPERVVSDGNSRGAFAILGFYNDPYFGLTSADFVAELNITRSIEGFTFNPESSLDEPHKFAADSLVLYLTYTRNTWYGDRNAMHRVRVFELNERLGATQRYFSNEPMTGRYYPTLLGEKDVSAYGGLTDSIWNLPNYQHEVSIRLSDELANRFFNLSARDLAHRDSLKDAFNGLFITTAPPANPHMIGSLLRIDLLHPRSRLVLYYRRELRERRSDGTYQLLQVDPLSYIFPINEESRFFNRFTHEHSGRIPFNDPASPLAYIQGMAGSYLRLDLSDIYTQWADSLTSQTGNPVNFGFGGIELIFHADTAAMRSTDLHHSPFTRQLAILQKNEAGQLVFPSGTDSNGVTHQAFTNNLAIYNATLNRFVFRMNQAYFEKVIRGEIEPKPFYLGMPIPQFNFYRVLIFNNHETLHPLVKVRYIRHGQ